FDTWSPGYLMFMAATHNGVSRLYETFGNAGADTIERTLRPDDTSRTWYRQNPPLPKVKWSQRNNNNYQQTGLLVSLHYVAQNARTFLSNFYLKSKRSIHKPAAEGPAAYVFPADDPRPGTRAELLRILELQGCEISQAKAAFTVNVETKKKPKGDDKDKEKDGAAAGGSKKEEKKTELVPREFAAGSFLVRMDQPYSRIADMLLDYQYWSPDDPQQRPYDDTGWTFGELFGVQVVRVADRKVLEVSVERVSGVRAPGGLSGLGAVFAVNHNAESSLATLRFRLKNASFEAAEEPFEADGRKFNRGSFLIRNAPADDVKDAAAQLGLAVQALAAAPPVKTHPVKAPRIAIVHSWLTTQDEGWWRLAFDELKIPYESISTQSVAKAADLSARFDVLVFPPVGRGAQAIVSGMPMWGNPLPWKVTALTPNLGKTDTTDDMRPGLGWQGLANLRDFVRRGGLLIGCEDTAELAIEFGLTQGISVARPEKLKVTGAVVRGQLVDAASPIAYGYGEALSIYAFDGPIFNLSNMSGGTARRRPSSDSPERATGRGTSEDPDRPVGRPFMEAPPEPKAEAWEALPLTDDQKRNPIYVIPPAQRPRVVLRYADAKDLLVSGLV
ncbi:MAG: M14 family zinc carboxypeptidase, partial [Thermoanaerobaculia bacterium]